MKKLRKSNAPLTEVQLMDPGKEGRVGRKISQHALGPAPEKGTGRKTVEQASVPAQLRDYSRRVDGEPLRQVTASMG